MIRLDRIFRPDEVVLLKRGVIPVEMEDKWFIYWLGNSLYFHRSWTGFCVYVVQFAVAEDGSARIVSVLANRDPDQYSVLNDVVDAEMLASVIDVLLLDEAPKLVVEGDGAAAYFTTWTVLGRAMLDAAPPAEDTGTADSAAPDDDET